MLIWTFERHEQVPESFAIVVIIMVSLAFLIFLACKFLIYHRKRYSLKPAPKDEEYHIEPLPERWAPEEHRSVRSVELPSDNDLERMEMAPARVQEYPNEHSHAGPSSSHNESAELSNMQERLQVPDPAYLGLGRLGRGYNEDHHMFRTSIMSGNLMD